MKRKSIYTLTALLVLAFAFTACSKKERNPMLIVHVQEKDGVAAVGATVRAWPGKNAGQAGSIINETSVDQTGTTDASGDVVFEFDASVVLDIDVLFYKPLPDTTWIDTLSGHKVVKLEVIRQKSSENTTTESVDVK